MSIRAVFKDGSTKAYTKSVYQYDKGTKLEFEGIVIPSGCEINFSNTENFGASIAKKCSQDGVYIPDGFFTSGMYVYAWLAARSEEGGSKGSIDYSYSEETGRMDIHEVEPGKSASENTETIYTVVIPVIPRPAPVRAEEDGSGENVPVDMQYTVEGERFNIVNTGNDGEGHSRMNNYTIEGERLIFH